MNHTLSESSKVTLILFNSSSRKILKSGHIVSKGSGTISKGIVGTCIFL